MTFESTLRAGAMSLALLLAPLAAFATSIPEATGEIVLTIDGALGPDAPVTGYSLDLAALQALPAVSFETTTIWTEGQQKYTGVSIKALLETVGAKGETIVAEALNGYSIEIPIAELDDGAPILAYFIDDKPFSRRDKGPLWVIFPYDSDAKYRSEITYAYSIWQLHKLTVK